MRRKGTHAARKVIPADFDLIKPTDFDLIKQIYLDKVSSVITAHTITSDLVINWDQTGVKFVPTSNWTMDIHGSTQVPIKVLDDKREMTALLACTRSGKLLPPQLLYTGKTRLHSAI